MKYIKDIQKLCISRNGSKTKVKIKENVIESVQISQAYEHYVKV